MHLALELLLVITAAIFADVIIRVFLLFRLRQKIDARGDYLQRDHELGKGEPYTIALLGASSIYGEGTSVKIPFAGIIAKRVAKQGRKVVIHNLAVSGHGVESVVHEQLPKLGQCDLVIVYAGTKDCLTLTPKAKYYSDLQALAQGLSDKAVVWATIQDPRLLWMLPIWLRWLFYFRARQFTVLLKQIVVEHANARWGIVDFFKEGIPEARSKGLSKHQLSSDGIHLSDMGQDLMSEMIDKSEVIATLINNKTS